MASLAPAHTVMLGSFSKIVAPSFRVGWLVARGELMDRLVIARQAADLHTSEITQRILHRYLVDNDIDEHIAHIRACYGGQCRAMLDALAREFPAGCRHTEPEGGMFLWIDLGGRSSMAVFDHAIANGVAFVPGHPFYTGEPRTDTLRLNFSCSGADAIGEGIRRLGESIRAIDA